MSAFAAVYAEIELSTRSDLPPELARSLASRFPGGISPVIAVGETIYRNDPVVVNSVIYSRIAHDLVYLVFAENRRALKVHMQRRSDQTTLADVKRSAEHLAAHFADFIAYHERRQKSLSIKVFAGGSELQVGVKQSRWERVARSLADELVTMLSLILATILLSYLLREEMREAVVDGLIAAAALSLKATIAAWTVRGEWDDA